MSVKTQISQGVDLNELAVKAAREMLSNQEIAKREVVKLETESDTVYVLEHHTNDITKWEITSGLPFSLENFSVYVSLADVARNPTQTRRQLLERRVRRGFRDRLLAAEVLPVDVAKKRVLKTSIITL